MFNSSSSRHSLLLGRSQSVCRLHAVGELNEPHVRNIELAAVVQMPGTCGNRIARLAERVLLVSSGPCKRLLQLKLHSTNESMYF